MGIGEKIKTKHQKVMNPWVNFALCMRLMHSRVSCVFSRVKPFWICLSGFALEMVDFTCIIRKKCITMLNIEKENISVGKDIKTNLKP